jgi:exodeoxyribonuclease V alpha subunit
LTRREPLSPLGTARERLARALGQPTSPLLSPELMARVGEYNLGPEAAYLSWELTRCVDDLREGEERHLFLLVLASIINLHQGSTRLPVRGPDAAYLAKILAHLGAPDEADAALALLVDPRLAPLVGSPGEYRPLILDGEYLYLQRTLHFEEHLVAALRARLARPSFELPEADLTRALGEILAARPTTLSSEQQYAVLTAVHSPLAVITGGPGTGKTSIVVAILRMLARLGVPMAQVALAAPTGKAANRMKGAIRSSLEALGATSGPDLAVAGFSEPRTLHRLLGYSPGSDRFRYHAQHRLSEKVLIVDECSMIDLYLMNQLVHAVDEGARLILLGDAEQLPSVEAGAVFRSLLPPGKGAAPMPWRALVRPTGRGMLGPVPTDSSDIRWRAAVRLNHSYRMDASRPEGRNILMVAGRINEGRASELFDDGLPVAGEFVLLRPEVADVRFEKVELLAEPSQLGAFLDRWLEERILGFTNLIEQVKTPFRMEAGQFPEAEQARLEALFRHYEAARILCVTRAEAEGTGADAINAHLHAALARRVGAVQGSHCPGATVMMQHNDYDRDLFNGDQGLVLEVDEGEGPRSMVIFRRGPGSYGVFRLESLEAQVQLCFAMTVHKSQGSEFEHVALILPNENMALLSREVLYTAVTRSKTSVVIVGKRELLEAGAMQPIERFSGVSDKLAQAIEEPEGAAD